MRFSPFDFDVATSPEEQEAAVLRFREPFPKPATPPQGPAPAGSGATRLRGGDDTVEHDHSAR
jgi:hypothetical protein